MIVRDRVLRHNKCGHQMQADPELNPTTEVWVTLDKLINLSDPKFIIYNMEIAYPIFQDYWNCNKTSIPC